MIPKNLVLCFSIFILIIWRSTLLQIYSWSHRRLRFHVPVGVLIVFELYDVLVGAEDAFALRLRVECVIAIAIVPMVLFLSTLLDLFNELLKLLPRVLFQPPSLLVSQRVRTTAPLLLEAHRNQLRLLYPPLHLHILSFVRVPLREAGCVCLWVLLDRKAITAWKYRRLLAFVARFIFWFVKIWNVNRRCLFVGLLLFLLSLHFKLFFRGKVLSR